MKIVRLVFSACVCLGAVAAFFLFSQIGLSLISRLVLSGLIKARTVTIGSISGSLAAGGVLSDVVIGAPGHLPEGSSLTLSKIRTPKLFLKATDDPLQAVAMDGGRLHVAGILDAAIEEASVHSLNGLELRNIQSTGFEGLPEGTVLSIQRIHVRHPIAVQSITAVVGGKLSLPDSEPILFFALEKAEGLVLDVSCRGVALRDAVALLPFLKRWRSVSGVLHDIQVHMTDSFSNPRIEGSLLVKRSAWRGFALEESPLAFKVQMSDWTLPQKMTGEVVLEGGRVVLKHSMIKLKKSSLVFKEVDRQPVLNLWGTALVDKTRITIKIKGTLSSPELRITSEPPLPEEKLLFMLATGRSWQALEASVWEGGGVSYELGAEFLSYLFNGRFSNPLVDKWRLREISPTIDPANRTYGLKASVTDNVEAGYKVHQPATDPLEGSQAPVEGEQEISVRYKKRF